MLHVHMWMRVSVPYMNRSSAVTGVLTTQKGHNVARFTFQCFFSILLSSAHRWIWHRRDSSAWQPSCQQRRAAPPKRNVFSDPFIANEIQQTQPCILPARGSPFSMASLALYVLERNFIKLFCQEFFFSGQVNGVDKITEFMETSLLEQTDYSSFWGFNIEKKKIINEWKILN